MAGEEHAGGAANATLKPPQSRFRVDIIAGCTGLVRARQHTRPGCQEWSVRADHVWSSRNRGSFVIPIARFLSWLVVLSILPAASVLAAAGSAEPPFRRYSVVDGLTQSSVYDIAQDYTGHLWLTTARGLNRFDGRDFIQFTIADGMRNNDLTALDVAADNTVWAGDARGGLTILTGSTVSETVQPLGGEAAPITDLEVLADRAYAVVRDVGIAMIVGAPGNRSMTLAIDDVAGANSIAALGDTVFVVADDGLGVIGGGPNPAIRWLAPDITHIFTDESELWAIDRERRVGAWRDGAFEPIVVIPGVEEIVGFGADSDANVWVGTTTGMIRFGTGHVSDGELPVRRYDGFDAIADVYVDHERTLWVSTGSQVMRYLGNRFRHFKLATGDQPQTIWAITEDDEGRFWFGSDYDLLLRKRDETLIVIGEDHGVAAGAVRDLIRASDGTLWAGVAGAGLYRVDSAALAGEAVPGTESLDILDIQEHPDGRLWLGTLESGLYRYDPVTTELRRFGAASRGSVYSVDVAPDGSIWYGEDEVGLIHLELDDSGAMEQTVFGEDAGLRHYLFDHIRMLDNGAAWVATEEGGLYRFENGQFESFGDGAPYSDQTVYLVEPLANGSLVVGGEQGLYQFVPGSDRTVHYNQMSGFLGLENNVHATYLDRAGYLWIGTIDGASRMDTAMPMPTPLALSPQIISATTHTGEGMIQNGSELPNGRYGASIHFDAISLSHPGLVEMSYWLEGVDTGWSPPTSTRRVEYSLIPPGDHRFVVRARSPGSDWSTSMASLSFSVRPFFWQRAEVIASAIVLVLLLIRAGYAFRTRQIQRANDRLRSEVADRTRSIEAARAELENSNAQLSLEIEERRKAESAREEVETRFRKAFENAPIGMGLLDPDCCLFDANPALQALFWADDARVDNRRFTKILREEGRARFRAQYGELVAGSIDSFDETLDCIGDDGATVVTDINVSPVRDDAGKFQYAVVQVQDLTESQRMTEQLAYQATYDELTGLLNRRAFEEELQKAWAPEQTAGARGVLLYMDLDQFKVVNDTSGHAAGDQLLKDMADILMANVRASDTVGRLGGDEFGVMLWRCHRDVAARIAESIRLAVENFRFQWGRETYKVGISIGGVQVDTRVGDISEIQQLADSACFTAKEAGRNCVHMIEGEKDSARDHRRQIRWIQRIREAMDNNRFAIFAQEIRALAPSAGEVPRFEILLRLRDPESRRLIPPGAFLPAAERYGLSQELDEWVVTNLINALYLHQSLDAEPRRYWINLSGLSIGDQRFARFLRRAVESAPLDPGVVNFEITETAVIRNVNDARHLIEELREMGCEFALDDFGSGLSSFGYLRELPVTSLKIDGMFVRNIVTDQTDRVFVKSIIDIAHTLNIKTVCELIETPGMLDIVAELGADYAQGFAIGRPFELAPGFPSIDRRDLTSTGIIDTTAIQRAALS